MQYNDFQKAAIKEGLVPLGICASAGCLSGDTVVNFNRAGNGFKKTIEKAYLAFHRKNKHPFSNWRKNIPTHVRSLQKGEIKLHKIDNIVFSGKKLVYSLHLENGNHINATADHKIMTNSGFIELKKLQSYHEIMCDTLRSISKDKSIIKKSYHTTRSLKYHPYGSKDNDLLRVETHRLIYEANLNKLDLDYYIKMLKDSKVKSANLKYINPSKFHIHHIDNDYKNNEISNLIKVSIPDHKKLYNTSCNFNQGVPKYSKVACITKLGFRNTYDIQCQDPYHNFVANGIVVHNSGKSAVLVRRAIRLIQKDMVSPNKLLISTFTNDATDEIQKRMVKYLGSHTASLITIKTLHSAFYQLFREVLKRYFPEKPFIRPVNDGAQIYFFKKYINSNEFKHYKNPFDAINDISELKAFLKKPSQVSEHFTNRIVSYNTELTKIYVAYESFLKKNNSLDFDDMITKTYFILNENERPLRYAKKRFKYYLIDEAHDLSYSQIALLHLITDKNMSLIFDIKQSMYNFRFAQPKYLLQLLNDQQSKIIHLPINYRNPKKIIQHSNSLILNNNEKEVGVLPIPFKDYDGEIKVLNAPNEEFEACDILVEVKKLIDKGFNYKDITVLYRTHAQARAVIDKFIIEDIPHKIIKGSFYQRKEVRDIMSYLRVMINYKAKKKDIENICNKPLRYIRKDVLSSMCVMYRKNKKKYTDFANFLLLESDLLENHQQCRALTSFAYDLKEGGVKKTTTQMLHYILNDLGYKKYFTDNLKAREDIIVDTEMNFDALYSLAIKYEDPKKFLSFIDGALENEKKSKNKNDCISLMTLHLSKGQEFPIVFILSVTDITMPHYRSANLEEERRIMYVGMTRAKEILYISTLEGKLFNRKVEPSPFIEEANLIYPRCIDYR